MGKTVSAVRRLGDGPPSSVYVEQFFGGAGEAGGGRGFPYDPVSGYAGIFPSVFYQIIFLHGHGGGMRPGRVCHQYALLCFGDRGHGRLWAGAVAAVAVRPV